MEFNINPYYDDFEQNAKNNNYVKVLFKPGNSVQARELTQIQSILQNQIKSFGDHIFQDGSPVVGGNLSLDNKVTYLKLDETFNNEDIELEEFDNRIIIRDSDSAVQAKVLAVVFPAGGFPTMMIKYLSGNEFEDGDVFKVAGTTRRAKCIDSAASGKGTIVSINEGIFYVDGYFVQVGQQTAVVDAYSQQANVKIGLEISDEIIDYVADSTLLDPALGSFNYQAPGADRYQFNLTLTSRSLTTAIDESRFFELMRVENGAITKQVKYPIYSEIEKTLARRTFDESGDYTVMPFRASVAESIDPDNYIINIEPGKAYVKGFEFETLGTFKLETPKPRDETDTRTLTNIDLDTRYGNYLIFKDVYGSTEANAAINIAQLEKVDLHCAPIASLNIATNLGTLNNDISAYSNTKIGTARVRSIVRDSTSFDDNESNGTYRVYFSEISINPKIIRMNTASSGITSNTINLTIGASTVANVYQNVSVTILPSSLTPVPGVTKADVFANGYVFANSATANTFYDPTAATPNVLNKIIRIGDEVRQVVNIGHDATDGDYLICNTGFVANITGDALQGGVLQVFTQEDYTSNTTGQTRIIERYDGTTRLAYLDRSFDENAVPTTMLGGASVDPVLQLNFATKDIESFLETPVVISTLNSNMTANAYGNISVKSRLINGDVELFDNADNSLLYKLPKNYVKQGSLTGNKYTYYRYYENVPTSSGQVTINFAAGYESRPWALSTAGLRENLIIIAQNVNTPGVGGNPENGQILDISTSQVVAGASSLQFDFGNVDIRNVDIYILLEVNAAEDRRKVKTFKSSNNFYTSDSSSVFNYPDVTICDSGLNFTVTEPNVGEVAKINVANGLIFITDPEMTDIYPGDFISLYTPDVVKIRKVLKGNTTHHADVDNYEDITDHFVVDYGQRDDLYDHCKLILKQGYPTPYAKLTVHVDYFLHTYPPGASYFSVDSYESGVYNAGTIPIYYSSKNGVFNLQDCIDFRPTRNIANPTLIQTGLLPQPDSTIEVSFDYYLPRIDKLVLSKNKEFRIIKGVSDPRPLPPADESDSMTLYQIYLPPFVTNVGDIRLKYIENKRYTMKDIAKLDKRIERVEYYTALNNIETKALDDTSQYEDGTEKEKFGIIGENFDNFNISDYRHPDFNVSMDENSMTPFFKNKVSNLKLVSTNNADENERTITLAYTETPAITQSLVSGTTTQIQPFLFATFIGDMKLKPEVDSWIAVDLPPEIIKPPEYVSETIEPEITKTMVIVERCRARTTIVTVPTQAVNNSPALTEVPFTDPPEVLDIDKRPKGERVRKTVVSNEPIPPAKRKLRPIPDPFEAANQVVPDFVAPLIFPSVIQAEDPPYDPPTPDSEEPFTIGQKPITASKTKFDNTKNTNKPTGY